MVRLIRTSWLIRTVFCRFPSYELAEHPCIKSCVSLIERMPIKNDDVNIGLDQCSSVIKCSLFAWSVASNQFPHLLRSSSKRIKWSQTSLRSNTGHGCAYIGVRYFLDFFVFSAISQFLKRVLMECIDMKNSLDSKLQICSICSVRIRSRKWDIFEKPLKHNWNRY